MKVFVPLFNEETSLDNKTISKQGSTLKGKNLPLKEIILSFNAIALRKAKIVYSFGLSECSRV